MKLPLLVTSSVAGLAILVSGLNAADSPAATPAPAAASASAAPAAPAASSAPMMAPAADGPKADMSKVPAASDKKDISFDTDIEPIFKASCLGCHTPGTRPARAGLDLSTKAGVLKGGRGKNDLVVGHSDQSNIVLFASDAVTKSEMPPLSARTRATNPEPALTKDQIGLIRAWIDQGAK